MQLEQTLNDQTLQSPERLLIVPAGNILPGILVLLIARLPTCRYSEMDLQTDNLECQVLHTLYQCPTPSFNLRSLGRLAVVVRRPGLRGAPLIIVRNSAQERFLRVA